MKKVCVVTVSRADYGLLRWVIQGIHESPSLQLQLVTAGTHFSEQYGQTFEEITQDGFTVSHVIPIVPSHSNPSGILQALGEALPSFAGVFEDLEPDIVILLGDRSETLLAAYAATICGIPIAHIHGGEITAGAIDDAFRHAITKMAHLHFVAHEDYGRRVIQMGEKPEAVHVAGPLGHESIQRMELLTRDKIERDLGIALSRSNFLVTLHPETLHPEHNRVLVEETLSALERLKGSTLVFTAANQDNGGDDVNEAVTAFCSTRPRAYFVKSLGTRRYLSLMAQCVAVVGNSSSGIFEAPALGVPTINIGVRQEGRIKVSSVIDVPADREFLARSFQDVLSAAEKGERGSVSSPRTAYLPSHIIVSKISSANLEETRDKGFVDSP